MKKVDEKQLEKLRDHARCLHEAMDYLGTSLMSVLWDEGVELPSHVEFKVNGIASAIHAFRGTTSAIYEGLEDILLAKDENAPPTTLKPVGGSVEALAATPKAA